LSSVVVGVQTQLLALVAAAWAAVLQVMVEPPVPDVAEHVLQLIPSVLLADVVAIS
jgi:hypothetical protein